MTDILIDHNMEGQAILLWNTFLKTEWSELIPIRMFMFTDVGLAVNSDDREVWRFAQNHRMIFLTNNRSSKEEDSLERTILEENMPTSLPVLTVGNLNRIRSDKFYREKCIERILEIASELDNYLGTGRIFIP